MKKSFIFPIILMALLTAFFTFVLAFLNYATADRIAYNQNLELRTKLLYIFDIEVDEENPEEINEAFEKYIKPDNINNTDVYAYTVEDNKIEAYAIPIRGAGLWGTIEGFVGLKSDFTEIVGLDFTSHNETPGLGGRISEEWYRDQFRGINISNVTNKDYIIYKPATNGSVDAITGATLTSKAVSTIINEDLYNFMKGGK